MAGWIWATTDPIRSTTEENSRVRVYCRSAVCSNRASIAWGERVCSKAARAMTVTGLCWANRSKISSRTMVPPPWNIAISWCGGTLPDPSLHLQSPDHATHRRGADRLDLVVLCKPAVDQDLARHRFVSLLHLLHHRRHLARVAARRLHVHTHDHLAVRRRGELEVVRRPEPPVGHLHHRGLRVGRRAPRLVSLPGLLGLQFRQPLQRRLDPLGALAGGPLPCPLRATVRSRRVLLGLRAQRRDLSLGLRQRLLQRRPAAERRGPG